jgi:hypothetical protein
MYFTRVRIEKASKQSFLMLGSRVFIYHCNTCTLLLSVGHEQLWRNKVISRSCFMHPLLIREPSREIAPVEA